MLQIATGTTTVEVVAGEQTINTQDATLGNTFDSQHILALPFEGRDAAGVLSLQPGVTYVGSQVNDAVDTRNGSLNGGRSDQANITLDGVDNNQQSTRQGIPGSGTLDTGFHRGIPCDDHRRQRRSRPLFGRTGHAGYQERNQYFPRIALRTKSPDSDCGE